MTDRELIEWAARNLPDTIHETDPLPEDGGVLRVAQALYAARALGLSPLPGPTDHPTAEGARQIGATCRAWLGA